MNIAEEKKLSQWVESLRPGDEVMASRRTAGRFGARTGEISKVAKITATQIVLENGWRYDRVRNVGRLLDSGAHGGIQPVTQEDRDRIEHEALLSWIDGIPPSSINGWKKPPLHVLRALKAAYDEAVKETAPDES
jgi:hypothetical protein